MKQIKKVSLIFVLLFAMVGLSGCGGTKIANEYYEYNEWLNENLEIKEADEAGSKNLYSITNKSEYNLKSLHLALVPEDQADIKKAVKETKEFKDELELSVVLGIQPSAKIIGLDINANTTLTLSSKKKIDVANCTIMCDNTFDSFKEGELQKDSALKDGDKFKQMVQDANFSVKASSSGSAITITNDGASDLILNDKKVIYKYSLTNEGEYEQSVMASKIMSKTTGETLTSFYPLKEGLVRPTTSATVGAGKTVQQGSDKNVSDPIYVSGELY